MVDLNHLLLFTKVVEAGSFTRAAHDLAIPKATLSRSIARLESDLGAQLLHRTTRRLELTELGRGYYEDVSGSLARLGQAGERITSTRAVAAGTLRVAAPVEFAARTLMPWLPDFLEAHPKVNLELVLSDAVVDPVAAKIDVAFRTGKLTSSNLVARKLGGTKRVIVAAPTYLDVRGTPKTLKELPRHDAVVFGASLTNAVWRLHGPSGAIDVPVQGRIAVDSALAAQSAVLLGLGLGLLPESLVAEPIRKGTLRHVLPSYRVEGGGIYLVHASDRHPTAALRAFVDYCVAKMAAAMASRSERD